jgi:hypothetical protein
MDSYFSQPEVSNSDLTELKKYFMPQDQRGDIESAYRFGTLVDAIITEPEKIDYFNLRIAGHEYTYTHDEFAIAKKMLNAFRNNPVCAQFIKSAEFQKTMREERTFNYEGVEFTLKTRCKWDLWMPGVNWGGDIKSTTATSQKQFEQAVEHFDYDRQRAWYMNIAGSDRDILIGISKVNFKVFIVPINREHKLYKQGVEKYNELAFKYWTLFENFETKQLQTL